MASKSDGSIRRFCSASRSSMLLMSLLLTSGCAPSAPPVPFDLSPESAEDDEPSKPAAVPDLPLMNATEFQPAVASSSSPSESARPVLREPRNPVGSLIPAERNAADVLMEAGKPAAEPEKEDAWQAAQREGRHDDALKLLKIAVSAKPDDPAVLLSLAGELMRADRPQTAVVHLDRLLKRQPGSAEALLMRGTIRLSQKKYKEAVEDLLPVATLENAPPSTVANCGVALLMSGDHSGVDALAGEIINRGGPQVGEAFYVRCLSRLKRGLFDEARSDLASLEKSEADSSMVESARAAVARAAPPEKQERPDSE